MRTSVAIMNHIILLIIGFTKYIVRLNSSSIVFYLVAWTSF
jgi:hypothetical protein